MSNIHAPRLDADGLVALERKCKSDMKQARAFAENLELEQAALAADQVADSAQDAVDQTYATRPDWQPTLLRLLFSARDFSAQCYALMGFHDRSNVAQSRVAVCHAVYCLHELARLLMAWPRVENLAASYVDAGECLQRICELVHGPTTANGADRVLQLLIEASELWYLVRRAHPQFTWHDATIDVFFYWIVETQLVIRAQALAPRSHILKTCEHAQIMAQRWVDMDVGKKFHGAAWQQSADRVRAIRALAQVASSFAEAFRHDGDIFDQLAGSVHRAAFDIVSLEEHKTFHRLAAKLHVRKQRSRRC